MSKQKALRKIELMHRLFGQREGHICGECPHLRERRYDKVYRKCAVYGISASEATDWAKRWPACGMFGREYKGGSVVKLVRYGQSPREPEEPLEGQISMMEEEPL